MIEHKNIFKDLVSETLFKDKEDLITYTIGIFPYLCRNRNTMSDNDLIANLSLLYPSLGFPFFRKLFNAYYEIRRIY